jgi:hypothetical protein
LQGTSGKLLRQAGIIALKVAPEDEFEGNMLESAPVAWDKKVKGSHR